MARKFYAPDEFHLNWKDEPCDEPRPHRLCEFHMEVAKGKSGEGYFCDCEVLHETDRIASKYQAADEKLDQFWEDAK